MAWLRRRRVPAEVEGALDLGRGERVLACARDERTDAYVVATTARLAVVPAPDAVSPGSARSVELRRSWSDVEGGAWEPRTGTISVTWVAGGRAAQWTLREGGERFAQVFYERVAASLLIDAPLDHEGRPLGRVAIRRDLATGQLLRQVIWIRGVRRDDAAVQARAERLLDALGEGVGM